MYFLSIDLDNFTISVFPPGCFIHPDQAGRTDSQDTTSRQARSVVFDPHQEAGYNIEAWIVHILGDYLQELEGTYRILIYIPFYIYVKHQNRLYRLILPIFASFGSFFPLRITRSIQSNQIYSKKKSGLVPVTVRIKKILGRWD